MDIYLVLLDNHISMNHPEDISYKYQEVLKEKQRQLGKQMTTLNSLEDHIVYTARSLFELVGLYSKHIQSQ